MMWKVGEHEEDQITKSSHNILKNLQINIIKSWFSMKYL